MKTKWGKGSIILSIIVLGWFLIYARKIEPLELDLSENGMVDISSIDFSTTLVELPREWTFYPNELYIPEDFEGDGQEVSQADEGQIHNDDTEYGTYRLLLQGLPNEYYMICGYSIDYGMKAFVNGTEVIEVGKVSDVETEAIPCVNYITFPVFTGETGVVELVFQYSNFVHNEGGGQTALYLSSSAMIERYKINERLSVYLLSGGFILLAVYYILDGFLKRQRASFQLAFCCCVFALRDQTFYIVQLIPWQYDWNIHYRIIVLITCLVPITALMMLESLYSGLVKKWITGLFVGWTMVTGVMMMLVSTKQVVMIANLCSVAALPYAICLLFCLSRYFYQKKSVDIKDKLTCVGFAILFITVIIEAFFNRVIPAITRGGVTPIGMILFVIMLMLVLSLQADEDKEALIEVRERAKMLQKMDDLKSDFLQKMAHELRTPLTVISGYAQLSGWQLENELGQREKQEMQDNMKTISSEAKRLSDIVTNLLDISSGKEGLTEKGEVHVGELLDGVAAICRPIVRKHNNEFVVHSEIDEMIYANYEMLLQVFINLVVNANKHTKDGRISVQAKNDDENQEKICFQVIDTGSGIKEEDQEQVFQKGYSTDGGKGLGLSICREVVEIHQGKIVVKKSDESGTTMMFTIAKR
ncbi:MAG: ATP-binding protein [Eubacteriales bacterium]